MATRERRNHRVEDSNLKAAELPVGPPSQCPRCHGPLRVEVVTEPQPPRWACVMGHSGHFTWTARELSVGQQIGRGLPAARIAAPELAVR